MMITTMISNRSIQESSPVTSNSESTSSISTSSSTSSAAPNIEFNDDQDEAFIYFSSSDNEGDDEMMLKHGISDDEVKQNKYVAKFEHTYSVDDNIFSAHKWRI